jgi:hypothetical protein
VETETPRSAEVERRHRARLDALGPAPSAALLHVLMLPDSSGTTGLDATGIKESHLNRSPGG